MTASAVGVVPRVRVGLFRDTPTKVILALCFALSVPALAEEDRVRVRAPSVTGSQKWIVGTLLRRDERSLFLAVGRRKAPLKVPVQDVTQYQVSRGRRSLQEGTFLGAVVGAAVVGGAFAVASAGGGVEGIGTLRSGLVGGIVGAPLGAVIGAASFSGDRWQPRPLRDLCLGVAPTPGSGVAASVSFGF